MCVRGFYRCCCRHRDLFVVWFFCFFFFPLKREVSLFVRGKRAEAQRLPRVRPAPAPKSSSARGCRWLALPPAASAARDAGTAPLPSQLLKAIVSIACSSLLLSRCLRACSSFSNAAKIWGREGRREGEDDALLPKEAPPCPWPRRLIDGIAAWGCGPTFVPVPNRARKGPKEARGGGHRSECCQPSDRASGDPQGAAVTPGTCLILTRSQLARGEMKKTNTRHQTEGEHQNQDNDTFPPRP